jgi:hippurate hydrolase
MHNLPGLPVGAFATRPGAIMAATDEFTITIHGRGAHAARPHLAVDPIVAGAEMVGALQTIASRLVSPVDSVVVSVTQFHAGETHNVIAETAVVSGTVRSLRAEIRDLAEARLRRIVEGIASAHGATADVDYNRNYPVTRNHAAETAFAARIAGEVVGAANVDADAPPLLVGEDFSYMLEARPGAFIFVGNGDTAGLHTPQYDFSDEVIPIGCSYWVRLAEAAMPLPPAAD